MQPTSPLRNNLHIDQALRKIIKKKLPGLISVKKVTDETSWTIKVKNKVIQDNIQKNRTFNRRSQDLKKIFIPNGSIFIFNLKKIKINEKFDTSQNFGIYEMDKISSIDIDDKSDFYLAEAVLKKNQSNKFL